MRENELPLRAPCHLDFGKQLELDTQFVAGKITQRLKIGAISVDGIFYISNGIKMATGGIAP